MHPKSFPMKYFRIKHSRFLEILTKDISQHDFSLEEIQYFRNTLLSNIANFDDFVLLQIEWFLVDLHGNPNPLVRNEIAQLIWSIQEGKNRTILESRNIHNELLPKLHEDHIINTIYTIPEYVEIRTIKCPYRNEEHIHHDFNDDDDDEDQRLWFILWEYRKYTKINHYYYMIYLHDIGLKMQFIKRYLIKYDLARNGKQSGTALDVMINELTLQYMELNVDFRKYHGCISKIQYYNYHDHMMFPSVYNLIVIYDGDCINING